MRLRGLLALAEPNLRAGAAVSSRANLKAQRLAGRDHGVPRSVAENWNGKLVAAIVAGHDREGAEALCAIRDVEGVTIA